MSSPPESGNARLKSMRKDLYRLQGIDRLKAWLEYTLVQDEDPELHVSQHDPLSSARPFHFMLTPACSAGLDDKLRTLFETSLMVYG